jgi:thiamine kinase-like enzyme
MYELISDIKTKIRKILKENQLRSQKSLNSLKTQERIFSSVCINTDGRKVFLKIRAITDERTKNRFEDEILVASIFKKIKPSNKDFYIPRLIKSNLKTIPEWLIQESISDEGLKYHSKNQGLNLKSIKLLSGVVDFINKISIKSFPIKKGEHTFGLEVVDFSYHLLKISSYLKRIEAFIEPKLKNQIYNFFFRYKDQIDQAKKVLGHEDLNLNNIILGTDRVYITDWEGAMIANYVSNISDLYYNMWFDQNARKKLLKEYLKNNKLDNEFKILFRIGLIRWSLSGLTHCVFSSGKKEVLKKKISKKFKVPFSVHLKTIKKSLKNFESLL